MRIWLPLWLILLSLLSANPVHASGALAKQAVEAAARGDWSEALPAAKQSDNAAALALTMWLYAMDSESGASFDEINRVISNYPEWPEQKKLRVRAELSLKDGESISDTNIIAWFEGQEPLTGMGRLALADALRRQKLAGSDRIKELVRDAWRLGDFDEPTEDGLLSRYGELLTSSDHIARTDRLLWEERISAAKRMLPKLPDAHAKLAKARISLIENSKLATVNVGLVPSSMKNDPGLLYDRMRYRAKKSDDSGVRELLLAAPENAPYASKWWKFRELQVREAIGEGKYSEAMKLLSNHGQTEGANLADALWIHGWIQCEFTDNPRAAYSDFASLYEKVRYPVSRARAAYWAGRAAERLGDAQNASAWFAHAAKHPTTFYGQLALLKKSSSPRLSFPSEPSISSEDSRRIERSTLPQAIRLALDAGEDAIASRIIGLVAEDSDDTALMAHLASLGKKEGMTHVSVRAAKKALQQNVVLMDDGYPQPKTPSAAPLERALTLAITRQESEFDPRAKSPSGALGFMQLLPGTAKETAKRNDMGYSTSRLYEPDYNMTLGSMYLKRMINNYDGSYVMAIAAYNAGPGNVRKWVQLFGTPENNLTHAINWIETIPFSETRNYVQRVLENLQVYRALEGDDALKLDKDLER